MLLAELWHYLGFCWQLPGAIPCNATDPCSGHGRIDSGCRFFRGQALQQWCPAAEPNWRGRCVDMKQCRQCCISEELLSAYSFGSQLWGCGLQGLAHGRHWIGIGLLHTNNICLPLVKSSSRLLFPFYFVANVFWESKFIHVSMLWLYLATWASFFILLNLPPPPALFELNGQKKREMCVLGKE